MQNLHRNRGCGWKFSESARWKFFIEEGRGNGNILEGGNQEGIQSLVTKIPLRFTFVSSLPWAWCFMCVWVVFPGMEGKIAGDNLSRQRPKGRTPNTREKSHTSDYPKHMSGKYHVGIRREGKWM